MSKSFGVNAIEMRIFFVFIMLLITNWFSFVVNRMVWERTSVMLGQSILNIYWNIPETAEPGTYRIRNFGSARTILGPDRDYVGETQIFAVQ